MENKICYVCGKEKQLVDFSFRVDIMKYRNECKECEKARKRRHYENNKEKIKKRSNLYYYEHIEQVKKNRKKYRESNKQQIKEGRQKYYKENKQKCIDKSKEYYYNNQENVKNRISKYYQEHKTEIFKHKNRRKKEDKIYKLKCQVRNCIYDSFKRRNTAKKEYAEKILGCSINFFIIYLLKTYKNNYGKEWDGIEKVHIDHKKALKYATTEEEVIDLCKYTNLQLLKAKDNLIKSSKQNYELKGER